MRFIVDTNLPQGLASWLVSQGHEASHTSDWGMAAADDRVIWKYASDNGVIIITKDEDFVLLKAADPVGPSVVWIRIGNAVNRVLFQRLIGAWPLVTAKLRAGETVVEVR
jgi:predicted nuclease of predicted toxin-antitoxin system